MLTPESWAEITELFGRALELPAEQRPAFLARLAGEDPAIARELACLLDEHEQPGDFLPTPPVPPPLITDLSGSHVGPYRLVRLLGEGGMGAVYLAERSDGAFTKQVALKVLSPAFFHAQERFQQEREFLARLDHPNVTRLLDGGATSAGLPYLVVEYVDGVSITRYCADRQLSLDARLALLLQVCAGIAHAHQRLIIHSDIKPENILVTDDGTVKILDFGIAILRDPARTAMTATLHPATPAYSSPEQLSGEPITTASDVYSIGVVAHVVLTGSLPYPLRSTRLDEVLDAVLTATPLVASQMPGLDPRIARQLRGDLDAILARAIARDPERRYASAQQLAEDIERCRHGFPVRARPRTVSYRFRRFVGRYRVACALATLIVLSLVAGVAVSRWQANVARRRFEDLRSFAHAVVFDINDALSTIPGTTAARERLVDTALQYLDRLGRENLSDPALREELAAAYLRIGRVQGGAFRANLGDSAGALASFQKAIAAAGISTATAGLERVAIAAHIEIASLTKDPIQSLPELDAAIRAAEQRLAVDRNDIETLRLIADAYTWRATVDHEIDQVLDEERTTDLEIGFRTRVLALVPDDWLSEIALADAMAQRALALEQRTDYAGSLAELRAAETMLGSLLKQQPGNQLVARGLAEKRSRAGPVLLAMGNAGDAAAAIESAISILEPIVRADPGNAQYRGDLAFAWFRLAEVLRAQGQTARALALHQQVLAIRRARVARDPHFTFIRWDLSRSLNAVGQLLLVVSPPDVKAARALFEEARALAEETLRTAPSFTELRKQVARADEGLGQAALIDGSGHAEEARLFLERSLRTWQDVLTRGKEDRREAAAPLRVQALLSQVSANDARIRRP